MPRQDGLADCSPGVTVGTGDRSTPVPSVGQLPVRKRPSWPELKLVCPRSENLFGKPPAARERGYLWRAIDHEGEVLESYEMPMRDAKAASKCPRTARIGLWTSNRHVTDWPRFWRAAIECSADEDRWETDRSLNNLAEEAQLPFQRREQAMPARQIEQLYCSNRAGSELT